MEETSSDEDSRMATETRRRLREDPQGWLAARIADEASMEPYPVPPPPPDPLPPPATVPTGMKNEWVVGEDEGSSVYSEYANDVGSVDKDMMTDT